MSTSILFVCTFWGVRSNIAQALLESMDIEGITATSAGFESHTIGPFPRQLMSERNLSIDAVSPPTIFELSRLAPEFDYVVALCSTQTQEHYGVLLSTLRAMFHPDKEHLTWEIPDFMSVQTEGEKRMKEGREIVNLIEQKIRELIGDINNHSES